jgi:hypothetical protein
MRHEGHIARKGARSACRGFMGKSEGKRSLGRLRPRREDNIEIYV